MEKVNGLDIMYVFLGVGLCTLCFFCGAALLYWVMETMDKTEKNENKVS